MSDDWQVGDLAVCVVYGRVPIAGGHSRGDNLPPRGLVCKVVGVEPHLWDNGPNAGKPYGGIRLCLEGGFDSASFRFRKIRPDNEPCEEEFVTLLKRMKPAKVPS